MRPSCSTTSALHNRAQGAVREVTVARHRTTMVGPTTTVDVRPTRGPPSRARSTPIAGCRPFTATPRRTHASNASAISTARRFYRAASFPEKCACSAGVRRIVRWAARANRPGTVSSAVRAVHRVRRTPRPATREVSAYGAFETPTAPRPRRVCATPKQGSASAACRIRSAHMRPRVVTLSQMFASRA